MARRPGKPSLPLRVRSVYPRSDFIECLLHIEHEITRTGVGDRVFRRGLGECWHSLPNAVSETAIAGMMRWWDWDHEWLHKNGRESEPAKPRIELTVRVNRRKNLTLAWKPLGLNEVARTLPDDVGWVRWFYRRPAFGERPPNELLFVRQVAVARDWALAGDLAGATDAETVDTRTVAAALLRAAEAAYDEVCGRLRAHFDVEHITTIRSSWTEPDNPFAQDAEYKLRSWSIEAVAELRRQAEIAEIDGFEARTGCSLAVFAAALAPPPDGVAARDDTQIALSLRERGASMEASMVTRMRELLKRHRSDLVPWASNVLRLPLSRSVPR